MEKRLSLSKITHNVGDLNPMRSLSVTHKCPGGFLHKWETFRENWHQESAGSERTRDVTDGAALKNKGKGV